MKNKLIMVLIITAVFFSALGFIQVAASHEGTGETEYAWWWKKDKDKAESPPDLRGGPENENRSLDPVPLDTLQQTFPDTVFLHGPTTENQIALTFDDGPDPRFTPQILDVLSEYNVPATFFLMGARAEAYPELTTRIMNEGHIIGNHTFWHPDLVEQGEIDVLEREVRNTEETLANIIDYQTTLFRPPYGFLFNELVERLAELNYSVIGWSVDSLDWMPELTPEDIAQNVYDDMHPGAIILMHDGTDAEGDQTETIESLHLIIPELLDQGYEFVTVDELLNIPYQR
ncbi:polysaccharide deacetylase family protein [Bacillus shivajii]|uniref:polysaccharide deacetylase family protein n=1 Tax=Bacillus shivajii TaxID=1983719 RepID=UPI001CF9E6D7|nr:polysaccharide deacetylase family protein [Bacillus shivajii]UCZ51549.1 polysaccharide deacetylase family protein [Bacillus shivajii]